MACGYMASSGRAWIELAYCAGCRILYLIFSNTTMNTTKGNKIFIAYSKEDGAMLKKLMGHLKVLERTGLVHRIWFDGEIQGGLNWDEQIKAHLRQSSIILLLVSPAFIASDQVYHSEMGEALKLHHSGKAKVIPVLLRPCLWDRTPFAMLQALPRNSSPISIWTNPDEAYKEVVKEIAQIIDTEMQNGIISPATNDKGHRDFVKKEYRTAISKVATLWALYHFPSEEGLSITNICNLSNEADNRGMIVNSLYEMESVGWVTQMKEGKKSYWKITSQGKRFYDARYKVILEKIAGREA
jgi:predicted transcriptional regulator